MCTCGEAAAAARRRPFPRLSGASGLGLAFRVLFGPSAPFPSSERPACGVEWPERRARSSPGGEDDGVGRGCNDGLSRRGR